MTEKRFSENFSFFEIPSCTLTKNYGILHTVLGNQASLTQLVECHLAKVVVEGSSPLARSNLTEAVKWERSSAGRASDS